jgi:hypothetical protein
LNQLRAEALDTGQWIVAEEVDHTASMYAMSGCLFDSQL